MTRKIGIFLIVVLVLTAVIGLAYYLIIKPYSKEKRYKQKMEISRLYSRQNEAFGMGADSGYLEYDELNKNRLILRLAAYEKSGMDQKAVTPEDVEAFLSSEYDEKGKLAAKNRPENIESYIEWANSHEGYEFIQDYIKNITDYQKAHTDKYGDEAIDNMSESMLKVIITDFNSSADN